MVTVFDTLKALWKKGDHQNMYLLMSIIYDYMGKPLPDPVWWLAGDSDAISAFMAMLMSGLERTMINEGIVSSEEEVPLE